MSAFEKIAVVGTGTILGAGLGAKIMGGEMFGKNTLIIGGLAVTGAVLVAFLELNLTHEMGMAMSIGGSLGSYAAYRTFLK